jgi:membrane associated rhomboid family serine protease
MFPIRDENPTVHTSIVTYLLIILNVAAWVFLQGMGFGTGLLESVYKFGILPKEILGNVQPGTRLVPVSGIAVILDGSPNWLSLVTSMFMHGGWFHLIGNMWFLAIFGDNVEDAMGSFRFLIFYLLCGIFAAAAQIFSSPGSLSPMVGASGAIGGVMGAYAILYPRAPVHMLVFFGFFFTRIVVPAFLMLGYWFVIQIFGSMFSGGSGGGVAFWAHIGGFVAGIFLLKVFCNDKRASECRLKRGKTQRIVRRYRR